MPILLDIAKDPFRLVGSANRDGLRAYEDAAAAVGRLDAAGSLASVGVRELLLLRCMVTPFADQRDGMIALLRDDPEAVEQTTAFAMAIRAGGASARGGAVPTTERLLSLLGAERPDSPVRADVEVNAESAAISTWREIDELIHDTHTRTPPVLKAIVAAGALLSQSAKPHRELAALATALLLCSGGATRDTWLTLPLTAGNALSAGPGPENDGWSAWCTSAFTELAREARAAERGVAEAHKRIDSDRQRVREAFGRASYSALDLLDLLASDLIANVPDAARTLGQTPPTAGAAVARLVELGIAGEVTGRTRSRSFVYLGLVDAMTPNEGGVSRTPL